MRGKSKGGRGNSAERVGDGMGHTSELSCGGFHGRTVRKQTANVQPVAFECDRRRLFRDADGYWGNSSRGVAVVIEGNWGSEGHKLNCLLFRAREG